MTTAVATACAVCGAPSGAPAYRHDGAVSVSSTARAVTVPTIVYVCTVCGHVQTPPLGDLMQYYDTAYNVHLESEESDDLYDVRDGVPIYRAQHQADVALRKLALAAGARVLDYGCGKGMTLRALLAARPDLDGRVFDVSDAYRAQWDAFLPRERQAAYETPADWDGTFDAVLSFFALEHVAEPRAFLAGIRRLIRPDGSLHLIVPNVRRNVGDFIVVDHCNHFMPTSLRRVLAEAGFEDVRIDEEAHAAAYVVTARRTETPQPDASDTAEVAAHVDEANSYAAFWTAASHAVASYERDVARGRRAAIYGSGFYGVFIASRLHDRANVAYFLDRNPHQQTKRIFDRAVLAPEGIADDVDVVYVGLNPANARAIAAGVAPLHARRRDLFFL
ncbi:MAG TPA: class I SAM-dependent methyltransferase [Candidatus Elarobacter sp.]|jgi:cyclopropane fatty-acyl-phospholipid synthase-like methyltransferase